MAEPLTEEQEWELFSDYYQRKYGETFPKRGYRTSNEFKHWQNVIYPEVTEESTGKSEKDINKQYNAISEYLTKTFGLDPYTVHHISMALANSELDEYASLRTAYIAGSVPAQNVGQAMNFAITPEGQRWTNTLIQEYWANPQKSILYRLNAEGGQNPSAKLAKQRILEEHVARTDPYGFSKFIPELGMTLGRAREYEQERREYQQGWRTAQTEQKAIETGYNMRAEDAAKREQAWYAEQKNLPSYSQATSPTLGGMGGTPGMQSYYERNLPGLYQQEGMPEARQEYWEEKTKYRAEPRGAGGEWWNLSPEALAEAEEPHLEWEQEKERVAGTKDPWETFLSQYPFLEKYKALTPQQKGEYSGTFRPRTRFLG